MIEFSPDRAATALAYASGYFTDPKRRSYINFSGHEFLRGPDRIRRWEELYKNQKGLCACCLRWRDEGKLDMHHLKGHTKKTRCDCYGRRLANGELCIGVELICTLDPDKGGTHNSCHGKKDGRTPRWSRRRGEKRGVKG